METTQQRRAKIRRLLVGDRIAWLQNHLRKFSGNSSPQAQALVRAWRHELHEKREIQIKLSCGEFVSDFDVDRQTPAATIVRGAIGRSQREKAVRL
jgi:hypothetical protein